MYAKKSNSKKIIVTLLAVVLLIAGTIGGTLAWLSATSGTVTNTFTVGDVNIELKEHDLNANGTLDTATEVTEENTYKIVPGDTQPKDPFVRVKANSEDSWIFVQVKEVNNAVTGTANATKYVTWEIADGWTLLSTANGVSTYYRTTNYTTKDSAEIYNVLKGDPSKEAATGLNGYVSYDEDLTKANIEALDANKDGNVADTEMPQLIFKAFAVQKEAGSDANSAWNQIATGDKLS